MRAARGNALAETPDIRAYDKRALFRDLSLRLYRESNEWHKRQRLMRIIIHSLVVVGLVAVCSCRQPIIQPSTLPTAPSTRQANRPGRQADGSVLLPNQWSLRPVGRQVELRDFPVNIALHPGGRFAAVLHAGYSAHQITIVDV